MPYEFAVKVLPWDLTADGPKRGSHMNLDSKCSYGTSP